MTKREMTIEEAIEIFKEVRAEVLAKETELSKQVFENLGIKAVDLAIKILEQQPCEDCISREQAIRATYGFERYTGIDETPYEYVESILRDLPSVTPKGVTITDFADRCRECGRIKFSNLQDWLSTFNTESATECFTAVQQLKERINE
jgi:hypothetical protein